MIRATAAGLSGPTGNGGAEAARVADAFREADERRREELDRMCKMPHLERHERRQPRGCFECGSRAAHRAGCSQGYQVRGSFSIGGRQFEPLREVALPVKTEPVYCGRCGHSMAIHRGIVCHGLNSRGGRCRCDSGGSPCKPLP